MFCDFKSNPVACVAVSVMYLVDLIGYFSFNHARIKGKMTNNISCKFNWVHFHVRKVAQIKVLSFNRTFVSKRHSDTCNTVKRISFLFISHLLKRKNILRKIFLPL